MMDTKGTYVLQWLCSKDNCNNNINNTTTTTNNKDNNMSPAKTITMNGEGGKGANGSGGGGKSNSSSSDAQLLYCYEILSSESYRGSMTSLQSGFSALSVASSCQSR